MENTVQIVMLLLGVLFFVLPRLLTKLNKTLILDNENNIDEEETNEIDFQEEDKPAYKPFQEGSATGESVSDYIKNLAKHEAEVDKNVKQEVTKGNDILTDFELKKAVIYAEILKPKWKE